MSDPVSNTEIEDVLSSIRQLISQSKAQHRGGAADRPEKLILTPALRVDDNAPQKTNPDTASQLSAVGQEPVPHNATAPQPDKKTPAAEAVTAPDLPQDENGPLPFFSRRANQTIPTDRPAAPTNEDCTKAAPGRDLRATDAAVIANTIDQTSDQWEPDGGEDTEQTDFLSFHTARIFADHDGIIGENKAQVWRSHSFQPSVAAEQTLPPSAPLSPEPNGSNDVVASSEIEIVGADTDIIDEEIVQAMVARLVREELQGEVGEKITRSIRRFIRREIERAITLKELQ